LVDEARAVDPPPRYAAAHTAYLAGMESVDQVRAALQTIVLTRQPVPGLADRLFEAGRLVARGGGQPRRARGRMPPEVVALLDLGQDPGGQPSPGDLAGGAATAPGAPAATGVATTEAQTTLLDAVGLVPRASYITAASTASTDSALDLWLLVPS